MNTPSNISSNNVKIMNNFDIIADKKSKFMVPMNKFFDVEPQALIKQQIRRNKHRRISEKLKKKKQAKRSLKEQGVKEEKDYQEMSHEGLEALR